MIKHMQILRKLRLARRNNMRPSTTPTPESLLATKCFSDSFNFQPYCRVYTDGDKSSKRPPSDTEESESKHCKLGEEEKESAKESCWQKVGRTTLNEEDKSMLLSGRWLNDRLIHAAQQLMRADKDLLRVGSLQNPLLRQNLSFNIAGDEFVQILHSGGNHWVTVSTVGTQCPTVRVFDSLHNSLPDSTKEQIASLLSTKETEITLQYANVQKQPNDCDCGLFAIAFAMAIFNEQTPEEELFVVTRMREYLYDCIENKMMKHFPAKKRKCTNMTRKIETLKRLLPLQTASEWEHGLVREMPGMVSWEVQNHPWWSVDQWWV